MKRNYENSSERIATPFFKVIFQFPYEIHCVYIIYFNSNTLWSFNGISDKF